MTEFPQVNIAGPVVAGGRLQGWVQVPNGIYLSSATATLRWYTSGIGEVDQEQWNFPLVIQPQQPFIQFNLQAPLQPWTYYGKILKIHWELGVDLRSNGRCLRACAPFELRSPYQPPAKPAP